MKTRHALVIYLVGIIIDIVAGLMKILHLPGADEILVIGGLFQIVGSLVFIVKMLTHPKLKEFLDW